MNELTYRNETLIYEFLNQLNMQKSKLLILIAAKDTPGVPITTALNGSLHNLGLKADFKHLHWNGYCAAIYRGELVCEKYEYDHFVECSGTVDGIPYYLFSGPFHSKNNSIISANGINYSINTRGLNFVVYDLERDYVTDSVAFDTYLSNFPATRAMSDVQRNLINQVNSLNAKYNALAKEVQKNSIFSNQMFWQLYRKKYESLIHAKKRFFRTFEDNDDTMHLVHLCLVKMLKDFDTICKKYNIQYWIDYGTLLGAYRHGKCIPWDDDVDVDMMRNDIYKLHDLLFDHKKYKIEIKQGFSDGYIRYIRFMPLDENNPCFIDLFVHDYCDNDSDELWDIHDNIRKETVRMSREISGRVAGLSKDEADKIIFEFLDKQANKEQAAVHTTKNNKYILWSNDNFTYWKKNIMAKEDIFPLKRITLDGVECSAPNNIELRLQNLYGDVFTLPNDMDRKHIKIDETQLQAIKKYLND